jgi:glycosyltransferase involved in cell wall biosynthesis
MKFSFVIPAYNNYQLLHQLLWDIYKNCSPVYEVIVTDDGTDKETLDGMDWWTGLLPVRHTRNKKALGFLKNSNNGLTLATGDVLCLVSTDVRIYKDIVKYSTEMNSNEMLGGRYLDWDTGWNTFNGKIFPYLEGWLLCTSKDFWKEV